MFSFSLIYDAEKILKVASSFLNVLLDFSFFVCSSIEKVLI